MPFSPNDLEEFTIRIARKASHDEEYCSLLLFNNVEPRIETIQQAILSCDIIVKNGDIVITFPPNASWYLVPAANRLADLMIEELGEWYGFIMMRG